MSSSFTPIDPATISALNAGGERALEQIFRDHYPWLIERALERLKGERAAAPRLIAATVRELWEERDGFHTSAEIEAFFNEELRHRARAVRARLAAVHRFEKNEGVAVPPPAEPPTADQLWGEIAAALHQPAVDPVTAAKRRREHTSHEVAEHINTVTGRANWKTPMIIIAAATVVALLGSWVVTQKSRASVINELLGSSEAQNIVTRAGQQGSMTLAENSTARLAPETRLVLVPQFGTAYRTLTVSGAAAFTVAPDVDQPFEARIGSVAVQSEGGRFSVRDYADEPFQMVQVSEGSATVTGPNDSRTLSAGESVIIDRSGAMRAPTEDESLQALAWTEGRLVLRNVTLAAAAGSLYRWYGIDATVPDSVTADRALEGISVPLESSQAAIAAIEGGGNVRFAWVDGRMVFQSPTTRTTRR
jgi:ferric-dicitrate binding protein FerR (iron transport regulator)